MKKILFTALGVVSLTACRNDENTPATTNSIVGVWNEAKYITYDGKTNAVLSEIVNDACESKSNIDFKTDGNFSWKSFESVNGTCREYTPDTGKYTYNSTGKKLSVTWDGETETYTVDVLKHTATELEFMEESYDVNNDGVNDKMTLLLKRTK